MNRVEIKIDFNLMENASALPTDTSFDVRNLPFVVAARGTCKS